MENKVVKEYILSSIGSLGEEISSNISDEDINKAIEYYSNLDDILDSVLDQIDERIKSLKQQNNISSEKHYDLNDFFDCRISHGSLHLHVVPKSIKDDIRKMGSGFYTYVSEKLGDALDKLPEILDDPNNSDIKTIMAVSPLLRSDRAKFVFVNYGFNVEENVPDIFVEMFGTDRIGYVTMPKDKFLESRTNNKENKVI